MFRCALLVLATLHAVAARNQVATPAKQPAKPKRRRKAPELTLRQYALCGAVARTTAQLAVHPLNVAKTVLQSCDGTNKFKLLLRGGPFAVIRTFSRGAGTQALLSLPNGALNFMALEGVRRGIDGVSALLRLDVPRPLQDVVSAAAGTAVSTLVSLPQSILNDRIMGGAHANLIDALRSAGSTRGGCGTRRSRPRCRPTRSTGSCTSTSGARARRRAAAAPRTRART